jgi:adenylate kinase family enzyme
MPKLILIRGLPGSGKSTHAASIVRASNDMMYHFETDMFFFKNTASTSAKNHNDPSLYQYDRKVIGAAHDWCYGNTVRRLWQGFDVVVSNTFTQLWELDRYLLIPTFVVPDVEISVIEMRSQYGNIHNVPEDKLKLMSDRWESIPTGELDITIITDSNN